MEPFIAEIMIVPFNFAPKGWALCDGALLSIAQNSALFSILGTTYGGDGRTSFALPDLRGRAPMMPEQGPGLSNYSLGQMAGSESVALSISELPSHNHAQLAGAAPVCSSAAATSGSPAGRVPAVSTRPLYADLPTGSTALAATTSPTGGNQAHNNMQPFLAMNFIIATTGIFPSRA